MRRDRLGRPGQPVLEPRPYGHGEPSHARSGADVIASFESHASLGLGAAEAAARLDRFGPNALPEPPRRGRLAALVAPFRSPLVLLLLAVAVLAALLGHLSDAVVILVVVGLNAAIGAVHEHRAERSLAELRRLTGRSARVVRGGLECVVAAGEVVPGDLLALEAGDAVAADARLLEGAALQIAEAALTGESVPVAKDLRPLAPDTPLADRTNMVYAGTHVTAGRALALVVATGAATEIGRIAALAAHTAEPRTPLERHVAGFGRAVVGVAAVLFVAVLAVGLARGLPFTAVLMVAVSQVVGVIPEGLPVAMTIALAVGVHRMARRRAIVRRMGAVETLGSTTVICTDKTGTLTRNEMTVAAVMLPAGRRLAVTGAGLEPTGAFLAGGEPVEPGDVPGLGELLEAGALCNDATLVGPDASAPHWRAIGDPTEAALVTLAVKGGVVPAVLREARPRRAEIPFDPAERLMATQHDGPCGPFVVVKGAPEAVLRLCATRRLGDAEGPLDDDARAEEAGHALALAADALRVLAIGVVEGGEVDGRAGLAAFEGRVTLLGFVGQMDPPRPEARTAVALCRAAGVRAVMVTGDHRATALAIARDLGLATTADTCVDGAELERMDDATLAERVGRVAVFARVHPAQKLRIVQALRARGEVVAMTGDGVNDAPALVSADVGVAMGRGGTEVAKESSDLVLADDDFATLVAAVEEGRVVRGNIGKAVLLLVSTSAAEVTVLLLALAVGLPLPFVAVQILWNNLVTEGLVTIHLVMEPAEGDEMGRPPRPAGEPLVDRTVLARMAVMVPVMVAVTLGWFALRLAAGVPEAQARTETFTLLALCEWFNVLNCRSATRSALDAGLLRNRWLAVGLLTGNLLQAAVVFWAPLGRWFHTVPIEPREVLVLGVLASAVLWAEEGRKLLARRRAVRAA